MVCLGLLGSAEFSLSILGSADVSRSLHGFVVAGTVCLGLLESHGSAKDCWELLRSAAVCLGLLGSVEFC